jgi:cell division protein FtsB
VLALASCQRAPTEQAHDSPPPASAPSLNAHLQRLDAENDVLRMRVAQLEKDSQALTEAAKLAGANQNTLFNQSAALKARIAKIEAK